MGSWLKGIPPPAWTKRPNAKDDLRELAIAMRRDGKSYREIREALGVSKGSLSLWLRDVHLSEEHRAALQERQVAGRERAVETLKARRVARERTIVREAAAQVCELAESELFVAGVVAYWAEGSKNKPWRRSESVRFVNSDPGMIRLFLRWLDLLGIEQERIFLRLSIHESADVPRALEYWAEVVNILNPRFLKTVLKRHNATTIRKNTSEEYRGCLTVRVAGSTRLCRQIDGWFHGIVAASIESALPSPNFGARMSVRYRVDLPGSEGQVSNPSGVV